MDTAAKDKLGRVYVANSYVIGNVDFIFGRATAVIDKSVITLKKRWNGTSAGYVTAPSTAANRKGILIANTTVNGDVSAGSFYLGRPWHAGGDASLDPQTTVRNTSLSAAVKSTPWTDMSGFSWKDDRFAEYKNTGAGAGRASSDRPQLTDAQAAGQEVADWLAAAPLGRRAGHADRCSGPVRGSQRAAQAGGTRACGQPRAPSRWSIASWSRRSKAMPRAAAASTSNSSKAVRSASSALEAVGGRGLGQLVQARGAQRLLDLRVGAEGGRALLEDEVVAHAARGRRPHAVEVLGARRLEVEVPRARRNRPSPAGRPARRRRAGRRRRSAGPGRT